MCIEWITPFFTTTKRPSLFLAKGAFIVATLLDITSIYESSLTLLVDNPCECNNKI